MINPSITWRAYRSYVISGDNNFMFWLINCVKVSSAKARILCPAKSSSRCVYTRTFYYVRHTCTAYHVVSNERRALLSRACHQLFDVCCLLELRFSPWARVLLTPLNHCRGRSVHLAKILRPCSTCRLIAVALRYNLENRLISQLAPSSILHQREAN